MHITGGGAGGQGGEEEECALGQLYLAQVGGSISVVLDSSMVLLFSIQTDNLILFHICMLVGRQCIPI